MIKREQESHDVFTEAQVSKIHHNTMEVLANNGIEIMSAKARKVFKKHGARVEGKQVYISERLIEKQLKKVPDKFTLHARNPDNNAIVGGNNTVLAPGYGAPFVMEYRGNERRRSTFQDYINFTKLAGNSENIDIVGGVLVEPNDVEDNIRHARMLKAAVEYTDKCLMGSAMGEKKAKESIEMAAIVFDGMNFIQEHPVLITLINTNSPLQIDKRMSDALLVHARNGQPVIVSSLSMTGTTAPATLAGALVQQNAEILSGITLAQLVNPGTPVVYGSASSVVDLKSGDLAIGSPETAIMFNGTAQLGRFYKIPSRGGGALTDSLFPDAQSGYESMLNLLSAVNSGFNLILHSAGLLKNYMTMSYEKFIIDDEICGMVKKLCQGLKVDRDSLARDVILKVGSSGIYIAEEHTYEHMRDLRIPSISSREKYFSDKEQLNTAERANKKYREILEGYQQPYLENSVEQELNKYIKNIN